MSALFGPKGIIYKHRLLTLITAAALTIAVLMFLVRIPGLDGGLSGHVTVSEREGVYDLTGIEVWHDTVVHLAPGTTYYPGVYLTPETAAVPERVDRYKDLRADYLSQRFLLKMPASSDIYTLTFAVSGRHALRVYVNGELAGQSGKLGAAKQDTEVWENNLTCYAVPVHGKMEIILQSAQFYHYKRGASLAELSLYKAAPGLDAGLALRIKGFFVMGALICAASFLFFLFLFQPDAKEALYFSLACLAMLLREYLQSQAWTYFSFIPGNVSFMLEYLSMVLLTVFLTLYLAKFLSSGIKCAVLTGSGLYGACLLFGDSLFYTAVLKYYQALLIVCIVWGMAGLFRTLRRPSGEQAIALYGITVFYLAAVSDILMYNNAFAGLLEKTPVSEAALLIFVLAQTVSLFRMNSRVATEAKAAERKLAVEKEALDQLNRMKTEFLGNVSHELKTPLTVVSSNIQYVRNSLSGRTYPEDMLRGMEVIDGETARMALMVSQLLDVSRIDEGRMDIRKQKEALVEIIQFTLDSYYPVFSKNHNTLIFRKEGDIPPVCCDRNRVAQVLVNLITNAARHTRKGKIAVTVKVEAANAVVTVADTGEGIAPDRIPHLFERYYSHSSAKEEARTGGDAGTGLGLYICKYIVDAHGGGITVESEPNKGTTVRFTLPVADSPVSATGCAYHA